MPDEINIAAFQQQFAHYLLGKARSPGIDSWQSENSSQRIKMGLSVYRNNVIYSLTSALAAQFLAVMNVTGENFFRALAREYVTVFPPATPVLTFYGKRFPEFMGSHQACQALPWLPDLARLEYCSQLALHSRNEKVLGLEALAAAMQADPEVFSPRLHASVHLLKSDWPVHEIYQQAVSEKPEAVAMDQGIKAHLLIYRHAMEVRIIAVQAEVYCVIESLGNGLGLWQVQKRLAISDEAFTRMLADLFSQEIFATDQ